jgi:hypothetical protein
MSTQAQSPSPNIAQTAPLSVCNAAFTLVWGGLMLGLLAWWLSARTSELGPVFPWAAAALGAASLGLALIYLVPAFRSRANPGALAETEAKLRPLYSAFMLGSAAALVGLAIWAYALEKRQAAAESSSMFIMGLAALTGGLSLRLGVSGAATRQRVLDGMIGARQPLSTIFMIVGVLLFGAGIYFGIFAKGWREFGGRFPEFGGMMLVGLVFFSAGMYLKLTLDRPATAYGMRMLLLYVGGATGLLITVMTALRVLLWWKPYLAGGVQQWQGEEGWRFWVCVYVGLLGLTLLFASLMLAQVDIRQSAPMRRMLYGYNAILTGLLVLAMLVILNIIVIVTVPANISWTQRIGMYSLSGGSKNLLESLREPVKVYVLMPRYSGNYLEVRDLLDNMQSVSNRIDVEYLSPDLNPDEYRSLASKFSELKSAGSGAARGGEGYGRGLLIVYGPEAKPQGHAFIPDRELSETGPDTIVFKGEEVVMTKLQTLVEKGEKIVIYFTQDKNEPDLRQERVDAEDEYGRLRTKLQASNYTVKGLAWQPPPQIPGLDLSMYAFSQKTAGAKHEVPADCKILVIAQPMQPLPKEALEAIDEYMDRRGGKLVILSAARQDSRKQQPLANGMEELARKFGVQLGEDYVISASKRPFLFSYATTPDSTNPIAVEFRGKPILMLLPRTVTALPKATSLYQAEPFLEIKPGRLNGQYVWAETDLSRQLNLENYVDVLTRTNKLSSMGTKDTLTVAVALTDTDKKPRGLIVGDYYWLGNLALSVSPDSFELFRSSLDWLSARPAPKIGAQPRETNFVSIPEKSVDSPSRMILLPLGLSFLAITGVGTGVWVVRRK